MRFYVSRLSLSLILLLSLNWACTLEKNERPPDIQKRTGSTDIVSCPNPPKEIMNKGVQAEADILAHKIGQLVKASGSVKVDPQRIRQELSPQVANFEVIDYRMCKQYANGVLDRDDYRKFLTDIAPTLKVISPGGISQTSGDHGTNTIN